MGLGFWAQRVESEIFGGGGLQERGGGWFWLGRWGSGYNLGQAAKDGLLLWCNLQLLQWQKFQVTYEMVVAVGLGGATTVVQLVLLLIQHRPFLFFHFNSPRIWYSKHPWIHFSDFGNLRKTKQTGRIMQHL